MATLEELKKKKAQLEARIQAAEAKQKNTDRKLEARIKIIAGSAILNTIKNGFSVNLDKPEDLIHLLNAFITRSTNRKAILGENSHRSEERRVGKECRARRWQWCEE